MISTQRAIFVDFPTEIGRSQNSHFLFLNIARRPLTTQGDVNTYLLEPFSSFLHVWPSRHQVSYQRGCHTGRVDIKKWGVLEALLQMTPIRTASTCCKACDGVGEDEFALLTAFQRLVFFRSKDRAWQELKWRYWWISTEIGRSQNSHFLFLNIARRPLTTQGDVNLSSWTFLELLAFLAVQTSSELPRRMP